MMHNTVYDARVCRLGEGPLWHPERGQLFWFDILARRLLSCLGDQQLHWQFDEYVSSAGWIDNEHLLIASQTALLKFNIETGHRTQLTPLEAGNKTTRSNDGRADAFGGFWIGTMGQNAENGAGAIYRYYKGEMRLLFPDISIPNAICFSPDGRTAYFTDTPKQIIWRQPLHEITGWPKGEAQQHIDLRPENLNPDGAVVDAHGYLWNAQWGASRVARYSLDGNLDYALELPASQASCPAFGGDNLSQLFVTSASVGLGIAETGGKTYVLEVGAKGQREHRVLL